MPRLVRTSILAIFTLTLCLYALPNALSELLQPTARAATTFTVNSTGDGADSNTSDGVCNDGSGNCTLRAAIEQANATPGTDTIAFNIPGSGVRTITPATEFPTVTDLTVIDGYTQPGSSANTLAEGDNAVLLVELSGAALGSSGGVSHNGLTINAGHSVVRGLVINRFSGSGLSLIVSGENQVEGNFIGVNAAGTAQLGNTNGVNINAITSLGNANVVGGTSPAQRNVISGNGGVGLTVGGVSSGNLIQGNYIGTDASGTAKLANGGNGVELRSPGNTVGGTVSGARNVISGNGQAGLFMQPGTTSAGNTVQGNYIGTDASGTAKLGNLFVGIWINLGANHTIGGSDPAASNVISGNGSSGILMTDSLSSNNQINGNFIGTDASGARPLGNGKDGVEIIGSAHDNFVQQAGPTAPVNTIAFNAGNGVTVLPTGTGNTIRRNNIFSNGGLGIDLNGEGVTPNDAGDADAFPFANNSQNFPLITSVGPGAAPGSTLIQGTLNSKPSTAYSLDFFANTACDPSGNGEGARLFGSAGLNTDANGNVTFSVTIGQPFPAGRVFTATASQSASPRDTSEFSPCTAHAAVGQVEFSSTNYRFSEDIGDAVITVNRVGGSAGALTVNYATTQGTATAGSDYTATSGTLTFADGETTKTFTVHVVNDGPVEPEETIGLVLFNPTEPEVVGARGTSLMTIVDGTEPINVFLTSVANPIQEPFTGTSTGTYIVGISVATGRTVSVDFQTADGTAVAGQDYQAVSQTLVFSPGETRKTVNVNVNGDATDEGNETFFVNLVNPVNAVVLSGHFEVTILDDQTPALQFSSATYSAGEGAHVFAVTVVRSGFKSGGTLAVDYATSDGTASERSDYTKALGTLHFAAGETSKTFDVLITDDAFVEGSETVNLSLLNPNGGFLAPTSSAVLTITDNDSAPGPNPIDDPTFFVRQHYHDFLNREPDAAGLAFWTGQMANCGNPNLEVCRVNVSAAFFKSIEFQETGYLVERTYKVAFGDATSPGVTGTVPVIRLNEFLFDTQNIGRGVIVGQGDWQVQLLVNKINYFLEFIARPRFTSAFPTTMTPAQFVDALFANAGVTPTTAERQAAIDDFSGDPTTSDVPARARALQRVAENPTLQQRELNRAFVLMEYFGYLRRNPDDAPQPGLNYSGWRFWLDKLEEFNGNFVRAEMVKAFLDSTEYRRRFAQ